MSADSPPPYTSLESSDFNPVKGIRVANDSVETEQINNTQNVRTTGLSLISAAVFIVGEMAGGGILSLPKAIAGTSWYGIPLLVICCLNAGFSGVCLAKCWLILEERWPNYRSHVRKPFATIGYRACGNWMRYVVSFTMNITLFGTSTVFLLICSQLIQSITNSFIHNFTFCDWVPIVALILTPMMWLGSPQDFWPAAYSAMGGTMIGSVLLLVNIIMDSGSSLPTAKYTTPTFGTFSLSFGKILFAYGGACAFPTFQNDMKKREQFPRAVTLGFFALLILYLPISVGGYAVYGDNIAANIIASVSNGPLLIVIEVCFAIHLFFAFLIVINPVVLELEEITHIPNKFGWKRCLLRTSVMIGIVFLGESVPKFDKILDLIGGSSVTIMTFLMPPLFYYRLCSQTNDQWPQRTIPLYVKVILIQIAIIGICGGAASTYSALEDLFSPSSIAPPCYVKNSN